MYEGLKHAHSGLRWVVLLLLVVSIVLALSKWLGKNQEFKRKLFVFTTLSIHIQVVIGLVLLFIKPGNLYVDGWMGMTYNRFFGLEHPLLMVIAAVLVTVAGAKSKRIQEVPNKYRTLFIFNLLSLILILAAVPWPFRGLGAGWF